MNELPIDVLEIWNGPMRESNLKAVGLWHNLLLAGKKVPACGGSDFHRDTLSCSLAARPPASMRFPVPPRIF